MNRIVLHVGCGTDPTVHEIFQGPEWRQLRLDIDPAVNPDIVSSITDMSQVASGSVDAVWSCHNLEHLFAHEVSLALKAFYRVIKPGGFALIAIPDLQRVAEHVASDRLEDVLYESPAGPISPIDIIYGHRSFIAAGNLFMAHKTGFTARTIGQHLSRTGFTSVTVNRDDKFNIWARAEK